MMGNFPLCLLFFILSAVAPMAAETYLDKYGKLREELIDPSKYNFKVRPENETFINITLDLRTLNKLDIASQTLSTTFMLYMSWIDQRLTWPSTTEIDYLIYSIKEIWTPNLVVTNYVDNVGLMGIYEDGPIPLSVSNEGQVVWALRQATTTTCQANVMYYPYDYQTCNIEIMEWAHPISEVDLLPGGIIKRSYLEDGEWSLKNYSQHSEEEIGSHNRSYRRIKYTFEYHRDPKWYIPLMIIPLCVLSLLMPGIFFVPDSTGEKMAYGLTVLLSFTVISSFLVQHLPTVSTDDSLLDVYVASTMTCGAAIILVALLMLYAVESEKGKESEKGNKGAESKESEKGNEGAESKESEKGKESKNRTSFKDKIKCTQKWVGIFSFCVQLVTVIMLGGFLSGQVSSGTKILPSVLGILYGIMSLSTICLVCYYKCTCKKCCDNRTVYGAALVID